MGRWIVYCESKNRQLINERGRLSLNFNDAIEEIESGEFLLIDSPGRKYESQKSFLLEIDKYPVVVPFNIKKSIIQLITMFPDRRYKNDKF